MVVSEGLSVQNFRCLDQILEGAGYTKDNWPLITGQDAELMASKNIVSGVQTMSIYKDTRLLAENRATQACYEAADAAMSGTTPVSNCLYFRTPIEQVTSGYTSVVSVRVTVLSSAICISVRLGRPMALKTCLAMAKS